MTKEDITRFTELSLQHLYVKADKESHIRKSPEELVPGSYRWGAFMYSNLFREGEDEIDLRDKVMFIRIFKKLQDVHTICWSRKKLYELDMNRTLSLRECLYRNIWQTSSFFELRVCLHLWRMIQKKFFVIDDYMIEYAPYLSSYRK